MSRRQPKWKLTTYAAIERARAELSMPKYRMAEALGVSNGTYHNWARGNAVPSLNTQKSINSTLQALRGRAAPAPAKRRAATVTQELDPHPAPAAAQIVSAYLTSHPGKVSPDALPILTSQVMDALRGPARLAVKGGAA